ncbi:MAG TPA: ferritin-like domain-containing protein [Polyangia bacterium]|nr:ferritin-like domain-containing protein [Polyangia bacterium]
MDHDTIAAFFRRVIIGTFPLLIGGRRPCPPVDLNVPVSATGSFDGGINGWEGGLDDVAARCAVSATDCEAYCKAVLYRYDVLSNVNKCERQTIDGGLGVHIVGTPGCVGGRRPEGLLATVQAGSDDSVGRWLGEAAHLEAASVDAFMILAAELDAHGAAGDLVRAARVAADDERRHARMMRGLAARRGVVPSPVRIETRPLRSLEEIARENAIEGCVRETFAALLACRQAQAAGDPAIRSAMGTIATEETRHAALSWAVDAWSVGQLSFAARRRVREARREAADAVVRGAQAPTARSLRTEVGLPEPSKAVAIAEALRDRIW